jgi:heat shock protein HslJ
LVTWRLLAIDGKPVDVRTTLLVGDDNQISGQAACNRYSVTNRTALPALQLGPIRATRMACPRLAEEQAYFDALSRMTALKSDAGTLILMDPAGRRMEFVPDGIAPGVVLAEV